MKFSAAVSAILSLSHNGASAFVAPSSGHTASTSLYASAADPYASVIVAISSAADAAQSAAAHSASLASSLSSNVNVDLSNSVAASIMTPEAISAAQTKLSILESNIATSSDPAVMSKAIIDALDASIHAAEHAVSSTAVLTSNLAHFDQVLSNSMAMHHSSSFHHLLPPESAELAQANFATLIHNLSGATINDDFLTNFLADVDRKLDSFLAVGDVSASTVLMYGSLAVVLAYSQREAGVKGYKKELREMLEGGEFDINVLAKDVGLAEAVAIVTEEARLEDPAVAMSAIAEEEPAVLKKNKHEEAAREVEALLTTAAVVTLPNKVAVTAVETAVVAVPEKEKVATPKRKAAVTPMKALLTMAANLTPKVSAPKKKKVVVATTPKPPMEDVPMETLMKAVASEDIKAVAVEPVAAVEQAVKTEQLKVNVVQKKKQAAPTKRKVVASKPRPAASPLARLLAEELKLDLQNLGKGSGKNGKILIDDVRKFHARMEDAKKSMANMGGAYFATASA